MKLMWTREDDIRSGKYRPMSVHRMTARARQGRDRSYWGDTHSDPVDHGRHALPAAGRASIRPRSKAASTSRTPSPTSRSIVHLVKAPVSVLWWRSVGHTHTAYAKEHFFDVLAKKAGQGSGRLSP